MTKNILSPTILFGKLHFWCWKKCENV